MELTLRKANALQNSINEAIKSIEIKTEVSINEFQTSHDEIETAIHGFRSAIVRRQALIDALYEVRKSVGQANARSGINDRLSDVARLEKVIQFYQGLASNRSMQNLSVINGRLEKIRNRKEESRASLYGRDEEVITSVLTVEDINDFKMIVAKNKKDKQKLQDEILELNVKTSITLSLAAIDALRAENLL